MSVESFDPGANALKLGPDVVKELLAGALSLELDGFGLARERIAALAVVARHETGCDWANAAEGLDTEDIVGLVKLFTLGERLPGWAAGAQSPVIPLVAELKKRDAVPADLTAWIKSNTDNRFLPYGSLMDRL